MFAAHDPNRYWIDKYPLPLLALLLLMGGMIIVLHLAAFFQGLFPLFGEFILGRISAYFIAACFVILVILMYGTVRLQFWAWWGSLVFVSLLAISTGLSFSRYSFYEIILMFHLPAQEMEWMDGLAVFHDYHLVGLFAVPLLAALGLVIYSRRYFINDGRFLQW